MVDGINREVRADEARGEVLHGLIIGGEPDILDNIVSDDLLEQLVQLLQLPQAQGGLLLGLYRANSFLYRVIRILPC